MNKEQIDTAVNLGKQIVNDAYINSKENKTDVLKKIKVIFTH